jgi:hypothetical protein
MENSSTIEEVQQEEQLENDEKPPDSGGVLFNNVQVGDGSFGGKQLHLAAFCISANLFSYCDSSEDKSVFCI